MATPKADLFEILIDCRVPFVVIGGHAVSYHGYVRATEDHDIVFLRSPESEAALFEACRKLKAAWISDEIDPATGMERLVNVSFAYIQREHLMMLWTECGYLDIYDHIPGFPTEDVSQLFESAELLKGIRFVSLDWLRRMKRASGRPQDLKDLEHLAGP